MPSGTENVAPLAIETNEPESIWYSTWSTPLVVSLPAIEADPDTRHPPEPVAASVIAAVGFVVSTLTVALTGVADVVLPATSVA